MMQTRKETNMDRVKRLMEAYTPETVIVALFNMNASTQYMFDPAVDIQEHMNVVYRRLLRMLQNSETDLELTANCLRDRAEPCKCIRWQTRMCCCLRIEDCQEAKKGRV